MVTLEQGKSYRAEISLGFFQSMATNDMVASKLTDAGFTDVVVTGSGSSREATGTWPLETRSVELPEQVVSVSPA